MPLHFGGHLPTAGQLPSLQSYTQFLLFFPNKCENLESAEYQAQVIATLKSASRSLVTRFPWLGGQVTNTGHRYEPKTEGDSGLFEVIPYLGAGSDGGRMVRVVGRERFDISYQDIIEGKGSTGLLKIEDFSEKKLMPDVYDLSYTAEPVLRVEVTFLEGGVGLCVSGLHLAIDMTGLGEVVRLLGKACRGEILGEEIVERSEEKVRKEGKEKDKVVHVNDDMEVPDWKSLITKHSDPQVQPGDPIKATWRYTHFTKAKLAKIKALASSPASDTTTNSASVSWISTDDALTSFLWHRILLARLPRLNPFVGVSTTLCRALNSRRYLNPPLPKTSLEHCVACTYTPIRLTLFDLSFSIEETLPSLASGLREAIQKQANSKSLKNLGEIFHQTKDKNTISFGAKLDLMGTDVLFSSGAGLGVYDIDFGPLFGKPELVRRPWVECKNGASEGIGYFMPKDREGGVDVLMCLRQQDWESLGRDEVWTSFGDVIG